MTDSVLRELEERLMKATKGSRELDAHIWAALYAPANAWVEQSKINGAWCVYEKTHDQKARLVNRYGLMPPDQPYTSSIDAALTQVNSKNEFHFLRGAPGCARHLFEQRAPSEYGWTQGPPVFRGEHDHAPIAVLLSEVRARLSSPSKE